MCAGVSLNIQSFIHCMSVNIELVQALCKHVSEHDATQRVRLFSRADDETCPILCATSLNLRDVFARKMKRRKEGNVLFNDALNTFYLR